MKNRDVRWGALFLFVLAISLFAQDGYLWVNRSSGYNKEKKCYEATFSKISADGKTFLFDAEKEINGLVYAIEVDPENKRVFFSSGGIVSCLDDKGEMTTIGEHLKGYLRGVTGLSYDGKNKILWVSVGARDTVSRLILEGNKVKEEKRIKGFKYPTAITCDKEDGSVWIADVGAVMPDNPENPPSWVVKLDKNGKRLLSLKGYNFFNKDLHHIAIGEQGIAVTKDTVFVADYLNHRVVLLSKNGEMKKEISIPFPSAVVSDMENNVWVTASMNKEKMHPRQILKISNTGEILVKKEKFGFLHACPLKNGCWVATGTSGLTFIDSKGESSVFGASKYAPPSWELKGRARKIVFVPEGDTK